MSASIIIIIIVIIVIKETAVARRSGLIMETNKNEFI